MAARPRFSSVAQAMGAATALRRAVVRAGGADRLAPALGLKVTAIPQWTFCPPRHVEAVEGLSGVSRHDLRPDLYPRPVHARALSSDEAVAAHIAAGTYFARTGRRLSMAEGR